MSEAATSRPSAEWPVLRYLAGWLAGALPALAMITLLWLYPGPSTPFGIVGLGAYALVFPVMVRRIRVPRVPEFITFLLFAGVAFAVLSILTGWGNGLTDEGFTTPRFAGFLFSGHDPYVSVMTIHYTVYGKYVVSRSYYVYLPVLMFLQVPGLLYKWFSLAIWVLLVLLVRKRFDMAVLLAQPYVMIVAENGYNDPVVLLLLTVGFVGIAGRRQRWAEWLSLGCKQFANAFVLVYYAVRRDWRNFLATAGISLAFIAPFLVWGGTAAVCPTIFANRPPECPHTGGIQLLINYPVWPVWIAAIFYLPAYRSVHSALARPRPGGWLARRRLDVRRLERLPSVVIVAASSVITGLGTFVVAGVRLGGSGIGALVSAGVAAPTVVAWSLAMGGPWALGGAAGRSRSLALRKLVASQLMTVVVALAFLGAWIGFGGQGLSGEAFGLLLGVAVGGILAVAWGLPGPLTSSPPSEEDLGLAGA